MMRRFCLQILPHQEKLRLTINNVNTVSYRPSEITDMKHEFDQLKEEFNKYKQNMEKRFTDLLKEATLDTKMKDLQGYVHQQNS